MNWELEWNNGLIFLFDEYDELMQLLSCCVSVKRNAKDKCVLSLCDCMILGFIIEKGYMV